jgi:DNA processing protein
MAGIASATLIIEATEQSGTLATARMCIDYNRELLVVPGSIFSKNSAGPHQFMKLGATPITTTADIIDVMDLQPVNATTVSPSLRTDLTSDEQAIFNLLSEPSDVDSLIQRSGQSTTAVSILLMQLELKGVVASEHGVYRVVV